ncbi:MAG: CoA transferase, partial [Acidimicrobiia bacterium]|nr:CoA transferase [Acidimicrobiia bacterium]
IQGVTGMVDLQRDPASAKADLVRNFVADKVTSQATVQAILAALMARERDPERRGQHVEVSMLEAVLSFFWVDGMMLHTLVDEPEATMAYPGDYYRVYPTTDGAVIVMPVMPPFDGICRAAGHPEWIDDPRWADPEERYRNMAAFTDVLAEAIAPFSTAEITAAMNAEDVPVGQVVALERVHEHPQIRAMGSVVEHEVPYLGRVRQARPAWRFGRTPAVVHAGAPQVGDHTDEILAELGLEAAEIEALRASGALA